MIFQSKRRLLSVTIAIGLAVAGALLLVLPCGSLLAQNIGFCGQCECMSPSEAAQCRDDDRRSRLTPAQRAEEDALRAHERARQAELARARAEATRQAEAARKAEALRLERARLDREARAKAARTQKISAIAASTGGDQKAAAELLETKSRIEAELRKERKECPAQTVSRSVTGTGKTLASTQSSLARLAGAGTIAAWGANGNLVSAGAMQCSPNMPIAFRPKVGKYLGCVDEGQAAKLFGWVPGTGYPALTPSSHSCPSALQCSVPKCPPAQGSRVTGQ
ncbi:hypothetical protein [Novosphingobium aquae]|uniref:TolA protein n=1 Tax=Novosphingobium aquae TaxID=3133435 RepID=A0ABU8S3G9_9SPHN